MKTIFTRFIKNCTLGAALLVAGSAGAATYTAVSSGAWSNASIWSGGVSPGSSLGTLDNVIINAGANVTLDMDVEFSGILTSLQVNGSLQSSSDDYLLDMNGGVLSGTGSLTLHNLRFGTGATMTFTGTSNIDNMWNSSLTLDLTTQMDLNDTLFLDEGSMNLSSGGSLTFMSGSVVRIDNGTMSVSSGLLNNNNDYSVMYVGSDKNSGLELAGSGLTDVWVDLDDNDQSLSLTGNVTIEGVLHHDEGMIDLNGGSLTLMDDYIAESGASFMGSTTSNLSIHNDASLTSDLMFDAAGDELNDLTIDVSNNNGSASLGSSLTLNGTLTLEDGDFDMTSGTFTMATGSEIVVEDGHMSSSGAMFNGDNAYSVTYNSSSSTTSGVELMGSGLSDLSIDMDNSADSVQLMNSLTIDGELDLQNGGMAMNGSDLTLEGTLNTTSDGWISGDEDSDLTFNTTTLAGDTLWLHSTNYTFGDITINAEDESDLMVGSNLRAENINMTTGGVQIWDNELWLNSTGSITNADEDRYVMIDGSGSLVMNVQVSAPYTMYPVGTEDGYSPVGIQQNSGTMGFFKVNSMNGVWSNGTSGTDLSTDESVVNRTWDVHAVNTGALDLNMMAMWTEEMEANNFDHDNAYIMHYTGGSWDNQSQTPQASVVAGTMFSIERENITSLSPFAVRSGGFVGVNENAAITAEMYPNPVQNVLNCVVSSDEATTAQVVDVTGTVLYTVNVKGNHTIDFTNYPNGVYFVNYINSNGTSSYKVMKSL